MKNQKRVLLITILFLFFGMAAASAQEKDPQTVIIRVFEQPLEKGAHLTVTFPDGTTKRVELSIVNEMTFKGESDNGVIIQSEINEWKRKGFEIEAFSTNSTYSGGIMTTIILSKD